MSKAWSSLLLECLVLRRMADAGGLKSDRKVLAGCQYEAGNCLFWSMRIALHG